MSRDSLEGFRPQDNADQSGMRPRDALDQPGVPLPNPVAQPGRPSGIRIVILIVVIACAILGGVLAFNMTARPSPSMPLSTPTPTSTPASTSTSTGETVVRQGEAPSADPSTPAAAK